MRYSLCLKTKDVPSGNSPKWYEQYARWEQVEAGARAEGTLVILRKNVLLVGL